VTLKTSPPSCAECHEIWESKTPGILWATPACYGLLYLHFYKYCISNKDLPEETIEKKKWGCYCFLFEKKTPIKK